MMPIWFCLGSLADCSRLLSALCFSIWETMESTGKRKHSSGLSVERASSSVVLEIEPGTLKKRCKLSPCTGSVKNDQNEVSVQDPSTSVEGWPPYVDTSAGYECSICLESIQRNEIKFLPCTHSFHQPCIDSWITENRSCPVCRQETAPPQNARPPSNNQRQIIFERLQTLPRMRTVTNNILFNNDGFIRMNNDDIDMRRMNNDIMRMNNDDIDRRRMNNNIMRMQKDIMKMNNVTMRKNNDGAMIFNNGGTQIRVNKGGFGILNIGGIWMTNFNI